ncbi:MAG: hypothetical protein F4W95_01025 [Chloroflexi bacterium]|nr:hypothetical protein [Chloroflexota bacterium]
MAAPAATVTTIHQAKGREWDVVIVGSLHLDNDEVDRVGEELASYCRRPSFEPAQRIADFDYARQHYVAFSRPKRLLALTAAGAVHPRFAEAWDGLPRWDRMDRSALAGQRFDPPEATRDAAAIPEASRLIPYLKRLDVWVGAAPDVAAIQPKEMMNTMNAKHAVIAMARAPPARRRVA